MIEQLVEKSKVIAASNSVQDQKGANSDQTYEISGGKKEKDKDMMGGVPKINYPNENAMGKPLGKQQ